jgi:putative membrane protein
MKLGAKIAAVLGLVAALALVLDNDAAIIGTAVMSVGWGLLGLSLLHIVIMVCAALAWQQVTVNQWCGHIGTFLWARLVRDGVNDLLPVAQVGGNFVAVRLLLTHGAPPAGATAGILVDMTLEMISQFVFTLAGVALLVASIDHSPELVQATIVGTVLAGALLSAFLAAQRWGVFKLLERLLEKLALHLDWDSGGQYADLHLRVHEAYGDRRAVWLGLGLHLTVWFLTAVETWLALKWMGTPAGFSAAFIVDSLGQAVRSAAFIIPGGFGVQEGSYLALGALCGLPPETALALSLVRRVREVILGAPAIWSWHLRESCSVTASTATTTRKD